MLDARIACPQCNKRLKTLEAPAPGQRFRCPRCSHAFAVGASAVAPAVPPRPPVLTAQPFAPPSTAVVAMPAGIPPGPPPAFDVPEARANTRAFLMIAAAAAALLTAGVGLALVLSPGEKTADPVQKADAGALPPEDKQESDPQPPTPPVTTGSRPEQKGDTKTSRKGDKNTPDRSDPPPPAPVRLAMLPPEEQAKVDKAIDKGVKYLKRQQRDSGSWAPGRVHVVGLAALPALTLLECGVPASDPAVRKAVAFVRKWVVSEAQTYDLALAILLLDRLGDKRDRRLIQNLALRLAAGQKASGGWTYTCPVLNPRETQDLFVALQQMRPKHPQQLFEADRGDRVMEFFVPKLPSQGGTSSGDTGRFEEPAAVAPEPGTKTPAGTIPQTAEALATLPLDKLPARKLKIPGLPARLKELPVLKPLPKAADLPPRDGTDNSNTQFAILGVWAATRHGVPMERTLALLVKRFRKSQNTTGSWGYSYSTSGNMYGSPAMTCSGLLGLAVGHGLVSGRGAVKNPAASDPAIKRGLLILANDIGKPMKLAIGGKRRPMARTGVNYYFLWSVERVGVLFNLKNIGAKDWYGWGAEVLVDSQNDEGSWRSMYPLPTDTCFALLFLKRANLTRDLTKKLDFLAETSEGR